MAHRGGRSLRQQGQTMPLVRIAVLSDDRLHSEGLVRILASEVSFIPIAYDSMSDVPSPRSRAYPHVILLDSRLGGSLAACTNLSTAEGSAVILFGAPDDDAWACQALDAGARGILSKSSTADDMIHAIWSVRQGQIWARRRVMAARIDYLSDLGTSRGHHNVVSIGKLPRLSSREEEVFRHAASGLPNKELARRLDISEATVKAHMTHIFQKLGVHGRAELAAAYHGLIAIEDGEAQPVVVRLKT
jgi:DNA-binding NarL/FixJ family response regulator